MDYKEKLSTYAEQINNALDKSIDYEEILQKQVFAAMKYSLDGGGKRIRPVLLLEFARLCGVAVETAMPFACAIEMVHTYSLIHDDLPCMDDDDLRRGRPTSHIAFGEAVAVLAGDALLNRAFETMLATISDKKISADCGIAAMKALADAAGAYGMIGGQILDMEGEERALNEDELAKMNALKTGALIRAACEMGVLLSGNCAILEKARKYAEALGRAFQIQDDILNIIGSSAVMGKDVGNDKESGKSTFVSLYGLDACINMVEKLTDEAIDAVSDIPDSEFLTELARSLAKRKF